MNEFVHAPNAEQERPRWVITLVVAVACFGVGIGVVALMPAALQTAPAATRSTKVVVAAPPPVGAPQQTREPTSPTATQPAADVDARPDEPFAEATRPSDESNAPIPAVTNAPVTSQAPEATLTMIQGRVAYLRCDGLRNEDGRFPCPRDAELEQAVWDILATLPRCPGGLGRGGVDVRLDLVRGERTQVRVLPIAGSPEPALDGDRVYGCVGSRLARLSTALDPIYLMVSFRAALR